MIRSINVFEIFLHELRCDRKIIAKKYSPNARKSHLKSSIDPVLILGQFLEMSKAILLLEVAP